jgi:hypothetical protein
VSARIHFCTLFDSRYATRGLAMLESLEQHVSERFDVTILAMDDIVPPLIAKLGRPDWRVVQVEDLADAEFTALKQTRPHREFCWTSAPVLCRRMIDIAREGDFVIYVDSDLLFYADPQILLDELGDDGAILIHEHRYSPDRVQYEATSGRFNVGFVAFRVGDEARRCAQRWRDQVIEKCELDPDNGYCGDQAYLNEWPALYPGLRIMRNIGGGAAPWNLTAYTASGRRKRPRVDGIPLVFFHYHSFRTVEVPRLGLIAARPAYGYTFSPKANWLIFQRYARLIRAATGRARRAGFPVKGDETSGIREVVTNVLAGNYVLALRI